MPLLDPIKTPRDQSQGVPRRRPLPPGQRHHLRGTLADSRRLAAPPLRPSNCLAARAASRPRAWSIAARRPPTSTPTWAGQTLTHQSPACPTQPMTHTSSPTTAREGTFRRSGGVEPQRSAAVPGNHSSAGSQRYGCRVSLVGWKPTLRLRRGHHREIVGAERCERQAGGGDHVADRVVGPGVADGDGGRHER